MPSIRSIQRYGSEGGLTVSNTQVALTAKSVVRLNTWKRDIQVEYRPFLTIRQVNKVGRRHWIFCPIQRREAHLLSDGEFRAYKILLNMPGTYSVKEQFALDIDETMQIAEELGYIHARNYKTGEATVMTTDFVVECIFNGQRHRIAYTFKYFDSMFDGAQSFKPHTKAWRTFQKFEIERHYWARRGVEYRIITEKDATKEQSWNIQFCEPYRELQVEETLLDTFITSFYKVWDAGRIKQLQVLCEEVSEVLGISAAFTMQVFKFAVYHGYIRVSHDSYLRPFRPVTLLFIK